MTYISVVQAAKLLGISPRRVRVLALQKRIPGAKLRKSAVQPLGFWAIPNPPVVTPDPRIKPPKQKSPS